MPVEARGKVVADLADLFVDEIVIVEQPFGMLGEFFDLMNT